ncbi:hypothetical protein Poli38472_007645 [Pythium oligandrum]|uniref:tRNA-uridine aminocarboxypropyltransferase n=1 Tax=Pythium oligandrum TaxID=41045 RepID=A0A8K1CTF8_PYTOL|nr:hypothetical protein Poli38472_007645 [Pythium oligandrum]|eukprot:TMW67973.1 hypothetical protein Poli38472_007645 [Pythium oligandrum]
MTEERPLATPSPSTTKRRALCERCQRPPVVCYCAALPTPALKTQTTTVVVLQHTREQRQRQSISSVPVLTQVLASPDCVRVVPVNAEGKGSSVSEELHAVLAREFIDSSSISDADAVFILFPHPDAKPLDREWLETMGIQRQVLVAVDGTWTEAKKIVHHSQLFWTSFMETQRNGGKTVEFVCLAPQDGAPLTSSLYGELRKEPMEGCVSTLEAIGVALQTLEPSGHGDMLQQALCHAFEAMVSAQDKFRRQGRAAQEAKYGGPKSTQPQPPSTPSEPLLDDERQTQRASQGVVKTYVFYTTQTDLRQKQQLVQVGESRECTRDQAIAHCRVLNHHRKRGDRVSTLPLEAFVRQQQEQETQA